jgi:nucleosome binding factor SPN SPT16 subunit
LKLLIEEFKVGAKLKDIYQSVTKSILEKRSDLVDKLCTNFGSAVSRLVM